MPTPTSAADSWLPSDGSLSLAAVPITVWRRVPPAQAGGAPTLEAMPSLECVEVTRHAGINPSTAKFAYVFGDGRTNTPQSIEQALSTQANLTKTVNPGDRLLVRAARRDGTFEWIFDGFPYGFEAIADDDGEEVVLACFGVERRLWDDPITAMSLRNGGTPEVPGTLAAPNHAPTRIKAVFNQGGKKNCTPLANDYDPHSDADTKFPVFLDPDIVSTNDIHTYWTLPRAVAYLAFSMNDKETFVDNPPRPILDSVLIAREPIDGQVFDPADSTTYTAKDIIVPELPITGRFWPAVVDGLIGDKGFASRFKIRSNTLGDTLPPVTELQIYLQGTEPKKDLWLQARGSFLDLQKSNLGECHLSRDIGEAYNRWEVHGALDRHQACFVLACGFPSAAADAGSTALAQFDLGALTPANRNKYRLYLFDETGEGHYLPATASKLTGIPSLDAIFGAPVLGIPRYAQRRRPALGDLMPRTDDDRKPWRASLYYSLDYARPAPGLWDGSGAWKPIQGGYDILHDRLGIWINVHNPDAWKVDEAGTILRGITAQALDASAAGVPPKFYLMLECQIEADQCLIGTADRRDTAALKETVTRVVDARDRYRKDTVHPPLKNAPAITPRDDTAAATAEAISLRDATDAGVLDGPVTIPWFTTYYEIGHRIERINGRNLGLRTDGGTASTTPVLPTVRSVRWTLRGDQETHLTLSDGQQLRKSYKRRSGGRRFAGQGANGVAEHINPYTSEDAAPSKPTRHRTYGHSRP